MCGWPRHRKSRYRLAVDTTQCREWVNLHPTEPSEGRCTKVPNGANRVDPRLAEYRQLSADKGHRSNNKQAAGFDPTSRFAGWISNGRSSRHQPPFDHRSIAAPRRAEPQRRLFQFTARPARKCLARHQPRYRGNGPCFQASYARAEAERLVDCPSSRRSAPPWSAASSACRRRNCQAQHSRPSRGRSTHTVVW
jgi:hypothetical protein